MEADYLSEGIVVDHDRAKLYMLDIDLVSSVVQMDLYYVAEMQSKWGLLGSCFCQVAYFGGLSWQKLYC